MSKQIFYFAPKNDIVDIFKAIESNHSIKYTWAGLFDSVPPNINSIDEFTGELDNLPYGDWIRNQSFLITPKDYVIRIREVEQRKGGVKYAIDELRNDGLTLTPGGNYKKEAVIAGKLSTGSKSDFSNSILRDFKSIIKSNSIKKHGFYVTKGAIEKYSKGWRLTTEFRTTIEYDMNPVSEK